MNRQGCIAATAGAAVVAAALALGLLLTPAGPPLAPWTPPAPPPIPETTTLQGQVVADHICKAPRSLAVDAAGRVYAACRDGGIKMLTANAGSYSTFPAEVEGALGLGFGPLGGMVVAGGGAGLLHVGGKPEATPLAPPKGESDPALRFVAGVDDLKLTPEVLFVTASDHPHRPQAAASLLEHAGRGALYRYDMKTHASTRLLGDLQSPLAVAVGPDDDYAVIAETGAFRLLRYWLKGERAGSSEVFADQLPGYAGAVSFNGHGRFWVTITAPRSAVLDALAAHPGLRGLLARLPWSWLPQPDRSFALAYDLDGKLEQAVRLAPVSGSGRISDVVEHGPWLWFGSDQAAALVRVPLQSLIPPAAPPPPGWQSAPREPKALSIRVDKDDD